MGVLSIGFEDFRKLAGNHRIYFYQDTDFFEFLFLTEGVMVKSFVLNSQIGNLESFFADKMFIGAIKLNFRVGDNRFNDATEKPLVQIGTLDVEDIQPEEITNEDIQAEGVVTDLVN